MDRGIWRVHLRIVATNYMNIYMYIVLFDRFIAFCQITIIVDFWVSTYTIVIVD